MKYKVFIDGAEGTTGLRIHEYFRNRDDIEVLKIEDRLRKDPDARLARVREADVTFLCLPDAAAREIAALAPADARLIDTSTAHRTEEAWVYGLPELQAGQRDRIRESGRVANPGCHATGAILLLRPLTEAGVIVPGQAVAITSLTGYSGGGKKMIAAYEDPQREKGDLRTAPGQYGISQQHKHLPEIMKMAGLSARPAFLPVVADYYSGMEVMIAVKGDSRALKELYERYYEGEQMISVTETDDESGVIYANRLAGSNRLEISVHGDGENAVLTATFDNLGKGASGAAVQNMNIMLGIEETKGLI